MVKQQARVVNTQEEMKSRPVEKMIKTYGKVSTVVSPGIAAERKNWEQAIPAGPDLYREYDSQGMKMSL